MNKLNKVDVDNHINMLYRLFEINMLNTSKYNVYEHVNEIFFKTLIKNYLLIKTSELSENELLLIFGKDNIIDEMYHEFLKGNDSDNYEDNLKETLKRVLNNQS